MNIPKSTIAVVGGGTAGAASALFLARAGHRVTVYERVVEPGAVGAGILLQPSGMQVLQALGLLDEIIEHGSRIEKLFGTNPKQRTVLDVRYSHYAPGSFGLGLHRGALFSVLWNAVRQADIDVKTGIEISRIAQQTERATLFQGDAPLATYDCVIVADGSRSHLRDCLSIPFRVNPYPWGALWTVVPDEGITPGVLRQWFRHAHEMLGVMPTGFAYGNKQPLLSLFWSLPAEHLTAWRTAGLESWKETVLALAPIQQLLDHIRTPEQLTFASYADVHMPFWHDRRAVCIGDCAHATSPQLGQGANLAVVDAGVLAQSIAAEGSIPAALAAYSRQRKAHLRYYQSASRLLTPLFQSHSRIGSTLRDLGLGLVCRTPYTRGQMALTLSGTKAGWMFGRLSNKS